ncbi:hypothetical protein [Anthocerotibacter panamensis]|uniref:hypothetical protein n=1 Tax=Anthocerotibacter panamensis TaxID=2857077 RepID=UPI001C40552A|nr:hypothetical protein [Anthocerotibacter panamensis]
MNWQTTDPATAATHDPRPAAVFVAIFLADPQSRRPLSGGSKPFDIDLHGRDLLLVHEYFHADNGAGLGARHQTGWINLIAWSQ